VNQVKKQKIAVLIPVLNEEGSIAKVLDDIPRSLVDEVVVIDNGSTDQSVEIATEHGAIVLHEAERGYGAVCLNGIAYVKKGLKPDIIVFLDGDYSDFPEDMHGLIAKINEGYDFVLGSRIMGIDVFDAHLSPHSILGNKMAAFFLRILFGGNYTDLGPFRAIRTDKLDLLDMKDRNFGWTMEMQIKAIRKELKTTEMAVRYRKRYAGESKVTGNLWGSVKAFSKITYIVLLYFLRLK
jgi:glycosyltransferase involved in cell wall biosynthesis